MSPERYGPFPYSPIIDRPSLSWPNGKKLAVWIIPNIEFYPYDVEYQLGVGGLGAIQPNVMEWSRRDYGNRVGIFRLMDLFAERNIRATVALNSDICTEHPRIIEKALELDWEFMGHGETNTVLLPQLAEDKERGVIARTLSAIETATGNRPRGWLGPGLTETSRTLEHLAAEGVRYVADFVNDDQPYFFDVGSPPLVSIPYTMELNDTHKMNRQFYSPTAFADLISAQFETLYAESQNSLRVMAIALHPWISGAPHTVKALGAVLDAMARHDGVWFATGEEIIEGFVAAANG